jgi:hypothetical protein
LITPLDLHDIHLRSGKVVNKYSPIIIEEQNEEENPNQSNNNDSFIPIKQTSSPIDQPQSSKSPPFPERLNLDKQIKQSEFDLLDELKNVCIKIPLLQAIKDIPIYAKIVRELCLKKPGRKKKDPQTVQVIGKISRFNVRKNLMEKYVDPGNPIVKIHINNIPIANTLID